MRIILAVFILTVLGNSHTVHVNAQACLPTRLEIGGEARVTPGAANRIRSQPNTNSEQIGQIPAGDIITILEGPQCVGSLSWWYINYGNIEGWTVEAGAVDYFLEPYSDVILPPAIHVEDCKVATRLQVNGYGQVSSTVPSRLRDAPSVEALQVGQIEPLDMFQVIDGPICADGFNWWQVGVDGLLGWLAEGDADNYYVEVVSESSVIALTITPEPPLITYAVSWNVDGSRLAVATSNGILIYDTADWIKEPYLLDAGIHAIDIAFSPTNPDLLVMNSADTAFRFRAYLLSDREETILFESELMDGPMGGEQPASDFAFSADGSLLGFGGTSYDIYDTETWTRFNHLEVYEEAGNHYVSLPIFPSDLAASGDYGAGAVDRGIIQLFDFTIPHTSSFRKADPRLSTLDRGGRTQYITALQLSPDGTQLLAGDITASLQMWELETDTRTSFIRADDGTSMSNRINDIAFHPDGKTIATAESEPLGIVRVFMTENLEPLTVFGTNESHAVAHVVSYSPDGTTLLAVMDDMIYLLSTMDYSVITQVAIWKP